MLKERWAKQNRWAEGERFWLREDKGIERKLEGGGSFQIKTFYPGHFV